MPTTATPAVTTTVPDLRLQPPQLRHSIAEFGRVFWELGSSVMLRPALNRLPRGDGHSVMTLPGFMGADGSTAPLRRFLNDRGYKAIPWGLGRNVTVERPETLHQVIDQRAETEALIAERVEREFIDSGRKVTLIGWSLGGLYAVALAHQFPQWIRQVITLGTPFGDPRGTALYGVMGRLYEAEVDEAALRRWVDHTYVGELQVPVLALYSETDGIVGKGIARCEADPRLVRNVVVTASHVGFPFNPVVWAVIANAMAPAGKRWAICGSAMLSPLVRAG